MPKPRPTLDEPSQARLGEKLRTMYEEVLEAPVPEHLQHLVDVLQRLGLDARPELEPISLAEHRAGRERAASPAPSFALDPLARPAKAARH
jgi:hypothetical protein